MRVEIRKHPTEEDWGLCKEVALATIGKKIKTYPDNEWKSRMLGAMHSPIRVLEFCFVLTDIPYWVSVHLVRHVHAVPFVRSQRDDRQSEYKRGKAPQDAPVDMYWYMNAEELINIAHKRLCNQASPETRELVKMICKKVIEVNPEFEEYLVPNCVYRGGVCTEFNSCGYNKTHRLNES